MSLRDLPKLELHLHLEGAAPPSLIRGMAKEKSVDISRVFCEDGSYDFRDFVHFLSVYEAATSVLKSPEDYARLMTAVLEESASHGVIYTEFFVSPDFCGGSDVTAWREYLHAMEEAATRAEAQLGIASRGIVTCIRHFGPDKASARRRKIGTVLAVLMSAVFFGVLHTPFSDGTNEVPLASSLFLIFQTGFLGAIFAVIALRTRRIGLPIVAHLWFNSSSVAMVMLFT